MCNLQSPSTVSDILLYDSREYGELLTNLKLQKLLYYAQAWHLALFDDPLFEEDFQAWVHGPVLPSEYQRFQKFRWMHITTDIDRPIVGGYLESHLSEILDVFGSETAVSLELMTHREKPWLAARGDLPLDEPSQAVIKKKSMQDYYQSL